MVWIKPLPPEDWAADEPAGTETGKVLFCMMGHQWWETFGSPSMCPPPCNDYHIESRNPTLVETFLHVIKDRPRHVGNVASDWMKEDG